MEKRGQVAMEFLMTYGWAIIIILVAVGALGYLGVFSTSTVNRCEIEAPFSCGEVRLTNGDPDAVPPTLDTLTFTMGASQISGDSGNNRIDSVLVNGQGCTLSRTNFIDDADQTQDARYSRQIFDCVAPDDTVDFGGIGDKFSGLIGLTYERTGAGITREIQGEVSGEIE
tara:strand:- start:289 stop:798 length:510 start_codon:yes stop_codon:yes gene_type:complete